MSHDSEKENKRNDEDFEALSDEEKLEVLIKSLQNVEKQRQSGNKKPKRSKKPVIMLEFGGMFHPNQVLNFLMYYVMNLLVIYTVGTVFNLADLGRDLWVPLVFVFIYTLGETLFRTYILYHHITLAFNTLGFIFFFGYVTLFFVIDRYLFPNATAFRSETGLVVFTGMFVFLRYIIALGVKHLRDWRS